MLKFHWHSLKQFLLWLYLLPFQSRSDGQIQKVEVQSQTVVLDCKVQSVNKAVVSQVTMKKKTPALSTQHSLFTYYTIHSSQLDTQSTIEVPLVNQHCWLEESTPDHSSFLPSNLQDTQAWPTGTSVKGNTLPSYWLRNRLHNDPPVKSYDPLRWQRAHRSSSS